MKTAQKALYWLCSWLHVVGVAARTALFNYEQHIILKLPQ